LNSYDSEDKLKQHHEYCNNHEAVKIDLPKPGSNSWALKIQNTGGLALLSFSVSASDGKFYIKRFIFS